MVSQKRGSVLVVEDEPDFAALVELMLKSFGFEAQVARDAEEGLAKLEAGTPDMITLDVQMPRKSGLHFYRLIKRREDWRDIPVIVISGLPAQDPDWRGFMKSFLEVEHVPAPQAYLDKPIDRRTLELTIDKVLGRHRARSQATIAGGERSAEACGRRGFWHPRMT